MSEILTEDDLKTLREAQERLRHRACLEPVAGALRPAGDVFKTGNAPVAIGAVHRCQGGCYATVAKRGGWCDTCAELARRRARELDVAEARESVSPGGALAWCKAGTPEYETATAKARKLVTGATAALVTKAAWSRKAGSLLIIGPTGIGKSKVLTAIGHRIIDFAAGAGWSQPDAMRFARGIRYVSGLELGRARSQAKFETPAVIREAKDATLLLLDEIGYEESRFDPLAVRDVLRDRYDPVWKPTIAASGMTYAELESRYGEPTLRTITDRGMLIDLHPKKAA